MLKCQTQSPAVPGSQLGCGIEVSWFCTRDTQYSAWFKWNHPFVYALLQINEKAIGRMLFVVFVDEAPIAAENFRQIFSGEMVSVLVYYIVHVMQQICKHMHRQSRHECAALVCIAFLQGYVPKDGTNREGEGMPYHIKGKYFYRIIHR